MCVSGSKCARIALLDNRFGHEPDEPYEIDTPVNKLPHISLSFVCKEVQHEARVKAAHFYEVLQGIASKWPSRIGWHWHLRAGYVRIFLFLSLLLVHGARSYASFVATWICNLLWWLCGILDDCWHVFSQRTWHVGPEGACIHEQLDGKFCTWNLAAALPLDTTCLRQPWRHTPSSRQARSQVFVGSNHSRQEMWFRYGVAVPLPQFFCKMDRWGIWFIDSVYKWWILVDSSTPLKRAIVFHKGLGILANGR